MRGPVLGGWSIDVFPVKFSHPKQIHGSNHTHQVMNFQPRLSAGNVNLV